MVTPATARLESLGESYRVVSYDHDPASRNWGTEAARALGLDERSVFKTLVVQLDTAELVIAVVPVATTLNLKAIASVCQAKRAEMAAPQVAERATGYVVGGISPLGHRKRLRVIIDSTAHDFAEVFVSAGRRGMDIGISPAGLGRAANAAFAPIAN